MSTLKLKLVVTISILLLVASHLHPVCLGDEKDGGNDNITTPAPKLGRAAEFNGKGNNTAYQPEKRARQAKEGNEDEDDDGYMEGDKSNDNGGSKSTTKRPNEEDEGFPEDWSQQFTLKPDEETTTSPTESDDGYGTEDQNQDKGKGNGPGRGKGKKKMGLASILPEDCGRVPKYVISGYIAGGFDAHIGEYPPYVRVDILRTGEVDRDFCGGTLISNRHVITAAHCIEYAEEVNVTSTIYARNGGDKTYISKKFCRPPGYNPDSGVTTHDIGLITLTKAVEFNDLVQPACLPNKPLNKKNTFRAIGLGAYDKALDDPLMIELPKFPEVLQVLPVKVEECNAEDKHRTTICFVPSSPKHKGDTCSGDSGGPIFGLVDKRLTIFGTTSHGPPICKKGIVGKSVNADMYNLRNELEMLFKKCGQVKNKEHDGN